MRFWKTNTPEHKIKASWQEKTLYEQTFDKSVTSLPRISYIVTYLANYFVQRKNFSFLVDVMSREIMDFNKSLVLD